MWSNAKHPVPGDLTARSDLIRSRHRPNSRCDGDDGWNGGYGQDRRERHGLRGYDDVHLAATLAAADDNLVIATGDADAAAVGPVEPCDRGVMLLGTSVRSLER